MCFSAEASFAASAVITGIGLVAVRKAQTTPQKVFAAIPLLFGVQQFTEGLLWLALSQSIYGGWTNIATHTFLVFAWVIWPVYVPLSARLLERESPRKKWLNLFLLIGIVVSILLSYKLIFHNVQAFIDGYHIRYSMDYQFRFPAVMGALYFIPIAFSLFLSSIKRMWFIGALILITFTITVLFYRAHLISVWCFFAAVTSVSVLWMVNHLQNREKAKARAVLDSQA